MFIALESSLSVIARLEPLEPKIRRRRKSLADEIVRASESVALNIAEGRSRVGLDRPDMYRRAAGSAGELSAALRIAEARGYISHADYARVDEMLDQVRAMLWRLTH